MSIIDKRIIDSPVPSYRMQAANLYAATHGRYGISRSEYRDAYLAGYDAALALAQPLAEALELAFEHSCTRAETNRKWTAVDQRVHERMGKALAAYRAALGSPVK